MRLPCHKGGGNVREPWRDDPEPAIKSATGGRSTSAGTVSTASRAPTRILVSSADAFRVMPKQLRIASAPMIARARKGLINLPGLFRQHDRNAVADRIGQFCGTRDQLLPGGVKLQRALGQRADQNFEQFRIHGAFKAFG